MASKKPTAKHARAQRIPRWARIALTGLLLGLLVVAAGAFMNRRSIVPPPALVLTGSTEPTATASATSSPIPSAVPTSTASTTTTPDPATVTDPGDSAVFTSDAYAKPIARLASLLPKTVAGYKVGNVESSAVSAIVPLEPTNAGPLGKATIVVLTVFDKKTVAGAKSYVDKFSRAYPKDTGTVSIGTLTGRFGTDGSHLAAATFSRGRYAFEVVLTITRGVPRDLKSVTLEAAEAFGATKTAP
jgi:hypothetical protein